MYSLFTIYLLFIIYLLCTHRFTISRQAIRGDHLCGNNHSLALMLIMQKMSVRTFNLLCYAMREGVCGVHRLQTK